VSCELDPDSIPLLFFLQMMDRSIAEQEFIYSFVSRMRKKRALACFRLHQGLPDLFNFSLCRHKFQYIFIFMFTQVSTEQYCKMSSLFASIQLPQITTHVVYSMGHKKTFLLRSLMHILWTTNRKSSRSTK
jgi:hypothetical protein